MYAYNGAIVSLPGVMSYNAGTSDGDRFFDARYGNSLIDLPNLTTLAANTRGYTTYVRAFENGNNRVNLPKLTGISDNSVGMYVEGAGSHIDLPLLASWNGRLPVSNRESSLEVRTGTAINAPLLAMTQDVDFTIRGTGSAPLSLLTMLQSAAITVDAVQPDLSRLTNINGSSVYAYNGAIVSLPGVMSYNAGTSDGDRFFDARYGNSLIDLPNLTTLAANTRGYTTYVRAFENGNNRVNLPKLTGISDNSVGMYVEGAGSHIDLPLLASWNGRLPVSNRESSLEVRTGTAINAPLLAMTQDVDFTIRGTGSAPLSLLTMLQSAPSRWMPCSRT